MGAQDVRPPPLISGLKSQAAVSFFAKHFFLCAKERNAF